MSAERQKRYRSKPKTKALAPARWKVYYNKPGVREARRVYSAKRYADPVIKAQMIARRRELRGDGVMYKAKLQKYNARAEVKLRRQERGLNLRYGISIEDYEALCKKQRGRCAICPKKLEEGFSKHKHVDHDHKKGIIRGILCSSCNLLLGHAKDDPEILINAAAYLKQIKT